MSPSLFPATGWCYGSAMRPLLTASILVLLTACSSEDPRLPQKLYDDAVAMSQQGKLLEAKTMLDELAARYPDTPAGQHARQDVFLIEIQVKRELEERQRQVRSIMKRTTDALTRYKDKHGEYPTELRALAPDYLEQVPETPWGHPFFYRAYVSRPTEEVRHGRSTTMRFNTKQDSYFLVCLGTDLQPGGTDMASDIKIVNGEPFADKLLPTIPLPQPVR
ncbi:MAG: Type secretion system protein [Holophagaceae bacterium]|nr:Type secretion system protein [Holophagaceae bacterium]